MVIADAVAVVHRHSPRSGTGGPSAHRHADVRRARQLLTSFGWSSGGAAAAPQGRPFVGLHRERPSDGSGSGDAGHKVVWNAGRVSGVNLNDWHSPLRGAGRCAVRATETYPWTVSEVMFYGVDEVGPVHRAGAAGHHIR